MVELRSADVGPSTGRLPDFLVLGAPKSGTTSLAAWLGAHRDVYVPPQKELHFFSREDHWSNGTQWYRQALSDGGQRLVGEATPNYLGHEAAAARIAATVPKARLIALLREPVDRAWSHYSYDRDLEIGPERRPFETIVASAGSPDEHRYLADGRYVRHLERFAAHVPREQLLVLWFDDLRDEPERVWRDVCAFLDLDPDPVPAAVGSVHNRHYRVRAPQIRRAMVRWRAWKRLPFGLAPRIDRLVRAEGGYDAIPADLRERLCASYADDDRALSEWLGKPLPAGWTQ
jgi:hypothetical protein